MRLASFFAARSSDDARLARCRATEGTQQEQDRRERRSRPCAASGQLSTSAMRDRTPTTSSAKNNKKSPRRDHVADGARFRHGARANAWLRARPVKGFMPWLWLIVGGLFEVGFTTSLRFVDGFRNVPWTIAFLGLGRDQHGAARGRVAIDPDGHRLCGLGRDRRRRHRDRRDPVVSSPPELIRAVSPSQAAPLVSLTFR